MYINTRKERFC